MARMRTVDVARCPTAFGGDVGARRPDAAIAVGRLLSELKETVGVPLHTIAVGRLLSELERSVGLPFYAISGRSHQCGFFSFRRPDGSLEAVFFRDDRVLDLLETTCDPMI